MNSGFSHVSIASIKLASFMRDSMELRRQKSIKRPWAWLGRNRNRAKIIDVPVPCSGRLSNPVSRRSMPSDQDNNINYAFTEMGHLQTDQVGELAVATQEETPRRLLRRVSVSSDLIDSMPPLAQSDKRSRPRESIKVGESSHSLGHL